MSPSLDLHVLVSTLSRLSNELVSSEAVVSRTVDLLIAKIPNTRIAIWLTLQSDGKFVRSTANQDLIGESRFVYSSPIVVRGVNYGHIQVECLETQPAAGALLKTLDIVAVQLGLHSERARLLRERDKMRASLATEKMAARASGIVARDRGMSIGKARKWLQDEAARTGRTLYWLSDMLIAGSSLVLYPGSPLRPPTQKAREHAA